jgi:hypothetical protein
VVRWVGGARLGEVCCLVSYKTCLLACLLSPCLQCHKGSKPQSKKSVARISVSRKTPRFSRPIWPAKNHSLFCRKQPVIFPGRFGRRKREGCKNWRLVVTFVFFISHQTSVLCEGETVCFLIFSFCFVLLFYIDYLLFCAHLTPLFYRINT